tara:strand:+ start:477 stop:665 length:189 start_codon:yes stop_codon:yes gene_type:complete
MEKENKNKFFFDWFGEIREEIEVQFYGITGAIFFFVIIYFIFKPTWMEGVFQFLFKIKEIVS